MDIFVNVDNFVRAETDRMFSDIQRDAGGVNRFRHNRAPASIDEQTVIRLNRDTLYSFAIVDLHAGAVLTLPETGDRYVSAMIVNNDHLVTAVFHDAGEYRLDQDAVGSRYALAAVRILVDPSDAADIDQVVALQDQIMLTADAGDDFIRPDHDTASLDATRSALLSLAEGLHGFDHMFGSSEQVEPVRHLIGTAAGWGGLPTTEAVYVGRAHPGDGDYQLVLGDVPVGAFWSISVYNAEGFFETNPHDRYTVNSVTATPDADGTVTVRFVTGEPTLPNSIPVPSGWNYLVRLYRPQASILDGSWKLPKATRID